MNERFRLLDAHVGWDVREPEGSTGIDVRETLTLSFLGSGLDRFTLASVLLPRWLARGVPWFLLDERGRPARLTDRVVEEVAPCKCTDSPRRFTCASEWVPFGEAGATAVAARGHLLAVARAGGVDVYAREGEQHLATLPVAGEALFLDTDWVVWVVDGPRHTLRRFTLGGLELPSEPAPLPRGMVTRLAVDAEGGRWVVIEDVQLWHAAPGATRFEPQLDVEAARRALGPTGASRADHRGFCLDTCHPDGGLTERCFDPSGAPLPAGLPPAEPPRRAQTGTLTTQALDSGLPRCRWHRVRVEADVPPRTSVGVRVATVEDPQVIPDGADWWSPEGSPLDFLIDQPPGRYLWVHVTLEGDGLRTPTVRRIRLDLPRQTSMAFLPAVYGADAVAEDFTERLTGLFDTSVEELDQVIERFPALLDPRAVSPEVLPWLAGFLDLVFDPAWSEERLRRILAALPELYRRRGTPGGLARALELITGFAPALVEPIQEPAWGAVGQARLSEVRLFSRARQRFRVGRSGLGQAPLRSFGTVEQDPYLALAHQVEVQLPAAAAAELGADRALSLVRTLLPAHVQGKVRIGQTHATLGHASVLGIDTLLGPPPAPVLGQNVRLSRASILWPGRRGPWWGIPLGTTRLEGGRV